MVASTMLYRDSDLRDGYIYSLHVYIEYLYFIKKSTTEDKD